MAGRPITLPVNLTELSRRTGIPRQTLYCRLRRGAELVRPDDKPAPTRRPIDRALRAHGIRSIDELVYWFGDEDDAAVVTCVRGPWRVVSPHRPILIGRCDTMEQGREHIERWLGPKKWLTTPIHDGIVTAPVMRRARKAMEQWTRRRISSITDGKRRPVGLRNYAASRDAEPVSTDMMLSEFRQRSAKRDLLPGPWYRSISAPPPPILGLGNETRPLDEVVAKSDLQYLFSEHRERKQLVSHPFGNIVSVDPEADMRYAIIGDEIFLVRVDDKFGEHAYTCTVFPDEPGTPYVKRINSKLLFENRSEGLKLFAARQRRIARKYLEKVEFYVRRAEKAESLASGLDDDQPAGGPPEDG